MQNSREVYLKAFEIISAVISDFNSGSILSVLNREGIVDKVKNFDYTQLGLEKLVDPAAITSEMWGVLERNKDIFIIIGIATIITRAVVLYCTKHCKDLKLLHKLKDIKPFSHEDEFDIKYLKKPNPNVESKLRYIVFGSLAVLLSKEELALAFPFVKNMGRYLYRSGCVPDISSCVLSTYTSAISEDCIREVFPNNYEEAVSKIQEKSKYYDDGLYRGIDQFSQFVGGVVFYSMVDPLAIEGKPLDNGAKWALASLCSEISEAVIRGILLHRAYSRSKCALDGAGEQRSFAEQVGAPIQSGGLSEVLGSRSEISSEISV